MRNQPTIWESASRPLFVRSVWLEIARSERVRRGQRQRHFILDYKPAQQQQQQQQQLQQHKSLCYATYPSPTKNCGKHHDGHSLSCDLDCLRSNLNESTDDLLLIGSAKVRLHQPLALTLSQQSKATSSLQQKSGTGRRPSLLSKNSHGKHDNTSSRRLPELYELISRRGSYQDLQSTLSNGSTHPDERLAERVLNWLDLAGKTDVVKTSEELKIELATSIQRRESISRRTTMTPSHSSRPPLPPPPPPPPPPPAPQRRIHATRKRSTHSKFPAASAATTYSCHQRRPDSMKHITIIFNKEGIPVRLNRPARNIDLCSLAASAGTTRRLAGALASARLYKNAIDAGNSGSGGGGKGNVTSNANGSNNNTTVTLGTARRQHTPREATSERHNDDSAGKSYCFQKRIHEDFTSGTTGNTGSLHDSKKQLHIFMPSLPKKGLLTASLMGSQSYAGGGGDDGASALSGSFNELCKL